MRGKRYWMSAAAMGMSLFLFGCSAAFVPVEDNSEASVENSERETQPMESEPLYQPVPETLRLQMINDLEEFDPDRSYTDMDPEKAAAAERSGMRTILSGVRRKMGTDMSWHSEMAMRIRSRDSAFTALTM